MPPPNPGRIGYDGPRRGPSLFPAAQRLIKS